MRLVFTLLASWVCVAPATAAVHLNPDLVRPWNQNEKAQFPTPLAGEFKKADRHLIFVGDHHSDQIQTYACLERAFEELAPDLVVVEGVDFGDGINPEEWMSKFVHRSKEDLLREGGAGPNAARLAFSKNIPVVGGEPSIHDSMKSTFLKRKGFDRDDILNVQVLQRIPYRRDVLKITNPEDFFEYAIHYYKVDEPNVAFKRRFKSWYKRRTNWEFFYDKVSKAEVAVNCAPEDTFLQRVACAFNVNRDRVLVQNIEKLLRTYKRIMVVYGTGHFVQEYPAFVQGFGAPPEYLNLSPGI